MKSLENLARSLKKAHSISRVSDLGGRHPKKDIMPDQPQESERAPRRIGEYTRISSMDVHKPAKVPDAEKESGKVSKNISKVRENMKQGMSPESAVRSAYPGYTAKQIGAFLREHKLEPLMKGANSWDSALDKLIGKHSQIDTRNGRERFQAQHGIPTQVHKSISDDDVDANIAKSRHMHRTNGFRWHESEHLK